MQSDKVQWFPGHMAKTKRLIRDSLGLVDIVIEVLDARIPMSSHNPDIEKLLETSLGLFYSIKHLLRIRI